MDKDELEVKLKAVEAERDAYKARCVKMEAFMPEPRTDEAFRDLICKLRCDLAAVEKELDTARADAATNAETARAYEVHWTNRQGRFEKRTYVAALAYEKMTHREARKHGVHLDHAVDYAGTLISERRIAPGDDVTVWRIWREEIMRIDGEMLDCEG